LFDELVVVGCLSR